MALRVGIIAALMAAFLFSINVTIIYVALEEVSAESFVAIRNTLLATIAIPDLLKNPMHLRMSAKNFFMLITAGACIGIMSLTAFYSLAYIPPLDSSCIYNFQSVFMLLIGCIFLKERLLAYEIVMVISITAGVVFVCQPEFLFNELSRDNSSGRFIGIVLGICSSLSSSIGNAILRHMKETPLSVFNYVLGIIGAAMTVIFLTGNLKTPTTIFGIMCLISSGVIGCAGRCLLQYALKIEQATLVVAILPIELVFSALIQSVFLGIVPNILSISGSVLIITSVILLSLKSYILNYAKRVKRKPKEYNSESRKLIP
ncbi:Uncharacterised protein r2_g331 [Pycnogonum litorale]